MIKNTKRMIIVIIITILLISCSTVSSFYESWIPSEYIPSECFLQEGEDPQIYYSSDIYSDIYFLRSNYYIILGNSSYNGPAEDSVESEIESLCRETGAKIALYTAQYTDTRTGVTGYNGYISSYAIKRYDYDILLFVPMPYEMIVNYAKIGLAYNDLSSSERLSAHQNTGAVIDVVFEKSPAFYANLAPGDIITEVNGETIYDSDSLDTAFDSLSNEKEAVIKYIRDGFEQTTYIKLNTSYFD